MVRAMSKLERVWVLATLLACPASIASAQDAEQPQDASATPSAETPAATGESEAATPGAPAAEAPAAEAPAAEAAPAQTSTPRYAPRSAPPPPIMVVVLTTGRVSPEVVAAAQQALVDTITPMAGGRPVHALGAPELRDAIAACRDDACIGGHLGQAGAQAGVLVRLTARGRRPLQTAIEIRDPVSGAARREPITGELPIAAAEIPAAMAALAGQLEGALPNPPPPPATLLVTLTVDGARVQIDGDEAGTSPLAPVEIAAGQHEVVVTAPGYLSQRRQSRIQPGERARIDVTLEPIEGGGGGGGGGQVFAGGGGTGEGGGSPGQEDLLTQWWFWTAIGGGVLVLGIIIGVGVAVSDSSTPTQLDPTGIMLPPISGGM